MSIGATSSAIAFIRDALAPVLLGLKWELLTADSDFAAWNLLFTTGESGICIISWAGDSTQAQALRSLVTNAKISITLSGRRHLQDPASSKLGADGVSTRLYEVADRIRAAMLSISLPAEFVPEAGAEVPVYGGAVPVVSPEGIPLDALRQSWSFELKESF